MKYIFYIALSFLCVPAAWTQTQFISRARIEFERRTNVWAGMTGTFGEEFKKSVPQYKSSYFDFEFAGDRSIYQPGRESDTKSNPFFFSDPARDNVIYSDYASGTGVAHKNVFEKTFLVTDSLRKARWKITNDFREIAGFNCRRATTIIMDSVFVVAFYSDEIMIPGGPESFSGLPGMILGLVINRLHTTWYATKVDVNSVNTKDIVPPTKGKAVSTKEMMETLRPSLGARFILAVFI